MYAIMALFFLVPCALTCTDFSEPQTLYGDKQENLGGKKLTMLIKELKICRRWNGGFTDIQCLDTFILFLLRILMAASFFF